MRRAQIHITGIVQGVGFRPFVYREAVARGLAGWVLNASDGVHVEAAGPDEALADFVRALSDRAPAAARVASVQVRWSGEDGDAAADAAGLAPAAEGAAASGVRFEIRGSDGDAAKTTLVSPDIATCPDCLRELFDPADRRYHYPFINCTNCGPRFTIIRDLPYDRPLTSMAGFPMCPACTAEYADPADRRFHAQPDACFACGPHVTWREAAGGELLVGSTREKSDAVIARCAELLAGGGIAAVKGLGGFHLACDAGNEAAVAELRRRKRRSNKPLAVMVRNLDAARGLCQVGETEAELLSGSVRPIVLLRQKAAERGAAPDADAGARPDLAPSVAYDLPELGVMLPFTPLQHLLLAACAEQGVCALVMTSGNVSEEPIETDDDLAWERLVASGLADALLGNDRPILSRYDDSVVRVVAGTVMPVRRARGYAPQPVALSRTEAACAPALLACGAEQKATLALTREEKGGTASCFVSQHIGDVENVSTFDAWHEARRRLSDLFDLEPEALVCDAHPTYLASQWARAEAEKRGLPLVEVQHHHAHVAAVMAETAARGELDPGARVVGIAFDGTGAGAAYVPREGNDADAGTALKLDGTVWGGEVLVASLAGFTRAAHLLPWRLPGGAASVRDARRNAFALLVACDLASLPAAQPFLGTMNDQTRALTATMVERGLNSPVTTSMGRLFDAVAALLGICDEATYDGEPAIALEAAAWRADAQDADDAPAVPALPDFSLVEDACGSGALVADPAPVLRALLEKRAAGCAPEVLARAFHETVARMAAELAVDIGEREGIGTAVLAGGVFMNRLLLARVRELLQVRGMAVLVPRNLPVNDGCIAYGQAAVARARLAAGLS